MLKILALAFGLGMGIAAGGAAIMGGLMYAGTQSLETAMQATFASAQVDNVDHVAPSWADYSDCMAIGTAEDCKPFRPNALKEALERGQTIHDYVIAACHERYDLSMSACILEFFPD